MGDQIIARAQTKISQIRATTLTELAIKVQQYTKKVEVPQEYQKFAKVFSKEESKRYPPKCAWDHAICYVTVGTPARLEQNCH